jgi:hypothetical protein
MQMPDSIFAGLERVKDMNLTQNLKIKTQNNDHLPKL